MNPAVANDILYAFFKIMSIKACTACVDLCDVETLNAQASPSFLNSCEWYFLSNKTQEIQLLRKIQCNEGL